MTFSKKCAKKNSTNRRTAISTDQFGLVLVKYAPAHASYTGCRSLMIINTATCSSSPTRFHWTSLASTDPFLIQHNPANVAASSYSGSWCCWTNSIISAQKQRGVLQSDSKCFGFGESVRNERWGAAGGDWLFTHNKCPEKKRLDAQKLQGAAHLYWRPGRRFCLPKNWKPVKWTNMLQYEQLHQTCLI